MGDKIEGEGHIVVKRDMNLSITNKQEDISDSVIKLFTNIDERINSKIPQGIKCPKHNYEEMSFSCEKIFLSLEKLDIPVKAALKIIELVEKEFCDIFSNIEEVTTSHVRKAVSESIYKLNHNEFSFDQKQRWGDKYSRKYGNPDILMKIIEVDGSEQDLSIKYLRDTLFPHIITNNTKIPYENILKIIPKRSLQFMAEETLEELKKINIYFISYRTLYHLAEDLALQPPHPWLVNNLTIDNTIEYDLKRAQEHINILNINSINYHNRIHSCQEIIHHSCSAILAYYGLFLGCGQLRPLHNLHHILNLCDDIEGNRILWDKTNIQKIEGDLIGINDNLHNFRRSLIKIIKLINSQSPQQIDNIIKNSKYIYTIALTIYNNRKSLESVIYNTSKIKNKVDFSEIIIKLFQHIPKCKISRINNECIYLKHNISNNAFHDIKPSILLYPYYSKKIITHDSFQSIIKKIEKKSKLCNTIFFISNQLFTDNTFSLINSQYCDDEKVILFTLNDLYNIYDTKDSEGALCDYILTFFEKICEY